MHPNNLGSQLGILQVQYSQATYGGTPYKHNTNGHILRMDNANGHILRMDNANRNDAHKLIDVLINKSNQPSNSITELLN
jgi:hypothetical protein